MENNFFSLTDLEKSFLRPVCSAFTINHNSPERKIKSQDVVKNMKLKGYPITERSLRKIIGHIRYNNLLKPYFILSDSDGYWVSDSSRELKKFYNSMRFRAINILSNIKAIPDMIKDPTNDGQLDLFADILDPENLINQ